jgi:hypothetical protein
MRIPIDTERTPGTPILRRRKIGERFRGAVIHYEQRDQRNADGVTRTKPDGKTAKELIVHLLTIRSTMPVGRRDDEWTPAEGEQVRLILTGGAWGQWIEAANGITGGVCRGDVVDLTTTYAEFYNGEGPAVGKSVDEAEIDQARRKNRTIGYRGDLTITAATDEDIVERCKAVYETMRAGAAASARQPIEHDEEQW